MWGAMREWLGEEPRHRKGLRALQIAIGAILLFRVSTEIRFAEYLWGPSGIAGGMPEAPAGAVGHLARVVFGTDVGTYLVLAMLAVAGVGLVLGRASRIVVAAALLGYLLLELRMPLLHDGGDNVTRLVLIFMLFCVPPSRMEASRTEVWLHNVAVLAIVGQLCLLYLTSGYMKAFGDRWHHGTALYYISQVDWFTLPGANRLFSIPIVTTLASYMTVAYQVMFPVAILSRIKLPWLAVGISFHLGIAVFMGLVPFSAVMIGLELFVITDAEYTRIRNLSVSIVERVRRAYRSRILSPG